MKSFLEFLNENVTEANAFGSEFEQQVANNIQNWITANNLDDVFFAERYQSITEDDGNRDEDYSDVIIENLKTGEQIFVECKEHVADNISQLMVDFEFVNGKLTPIIVKGIHREKASSEIYRAFENYLQSNQEFQLFEKFLNSNITVSNKKFKPSDFYFDKKQCNDLELNLLISEYNKMVDAGMFYSQNKKFNIDVIRQKTINMLACGLLWRIFDPSHTWDICHIKLSGPGFSKMICEHYLNEKAKPVNYIQFGEDAFYRFNQENPLNIDCEIFPKNVTGKFDLKFTPRFGTGAMYITSRSRIAQKLTTKSTFGNDENAWPKYLG